eukprot:2790031-Rhodomonas_salina.2
MLALGARGSRLGRSRSQINGHGWQCGVRWGARLQELSTGQHADAFWIVGYLVCFALVYLCAAVSDADLDLLAQIGASALTSALGSS